MVYPRTGGGNTRYCTVTRKERGLSPHGRGKPCLKVMAPEGLRSIPARAGETKPIPAKTGKQGVYPRTGGGNESLGEVLVYLPGLSPHGRGKPSDRRRPPPPARSIPARAGETPRSRPDCVGWTVYPRTGGGNVSEKVAEYMAEGLSPHGRGKPHLGADCQLRARSIPARAGETI